MLDSRENERGELDVHLDMSRLPDAEIALFVHKCMDELMQKYDADLSRVNKYWVPVGIVGTLFWLEVTGWWITENSGIRMTGEQHDTLHMRDLSVLDPAQLLVFRLLTEEREAAKHERWHNPGLDQSERGEILGFLRRQCFESSGVPTPPPDTLTAIAWATLLYTLSEPGQDWVADLDETFKVTIHKMLAYKSTETSDDCRGELLPEHLIQQSDHLLGSCQGCGNRLWCVRGHCHKPEEDQTSGWVNLCFNCFLDEIDRIIRPELTWDEDVNTMCNFNMHGHTLDCASHGCPHAKAEAIEQFPEWQGRKLRERGSQRLLAFEEALTQNGGLVQRSALRGLLEYFGE